MAITYATLKDRVQLLINRDDAGEQQAASGTTYDMLDTFIANAERRFYRQAAARIPPLEKKVTYTVPAGTGFTELTIPSDYYETTDYGYASMDTDTSGITYPLRRTSPAQIYTVPTSSSSTSIPSEFAYGGGNWLIRSPNQTAHITIFYYGYLNALTNDTENWIRNNLNDILMYWAAYEASMYYGEIDAAMAQQWNEHARGLADDVIRQEIRQRASGATPVIRSTYRGARRR